VRFMVDEPVLEYEFLADSAAFPAGECGNILLNPRPLNPTSFPVLYSLIILAWYVICDTESVGKEALQSWIRRIECDLVESSSSSLTLRKMIFLPGLKTQPTKKHRITRLHGVRSQTVLPLKP
jgi:hypothetical protein